MIRWPATHPTGGALALQRDQLCSSCLVARRPFSRFRQVRLSGLAPPRNGRRCDRGGTARDRCAARDCSISWPSPRSSFFGQALIGGGVAHYRADPGELLRHRPLALSAQQSSAHLASATGDLLDRYVLCWRCSVRGRHVWEGSEPAGRHQCAIRRHCRRCGWQPAGGMGRAPAMAGRRLVLVWQSRLGVPRDRPRLADSARDRTDLLVLAVVAQLGTGAPRSGTARPHHVLPDRGRRDTGVLPARAVFRWHRPTIPSSTLGDSGSSISGRGLLRAFRDCNRRHRVLSTRPGGAASWHCAPSISI